MGARLSGKRAGVGQVTWGGAGVPVAGEILAVPGTPLTSLLDPRACLRPAWCQVRGWRPRAICGEGVASLPSGLLEWPGCNLSSLCLDE